jgi:serine/threonine-protein kinase
MTPRAAYEEGQMVGGTPYRIVRILGSGGMGTVYEVEDTSIGKHYVLKTLNVELVHRADLVEMMRKEARLLARVKHKNIVDVITAGKTADAHGLPFIVMEKLDGITLKGLMQTHRLPWQFVRQIANELLEALYRMHHPSDERLPMIHRDIKPENIFLAKDDDGKYITKLLDLGIASWLDGQKHQGFHGTLKYAASEQLRCEPLSERTDLYQVGLVVFEMLTGRHPFADARSEPEMIEAALMRSPPRVSEFADVPRRVDEVIDAALSKNPAKRPRDAYVFMTALQDLREQSASRVPELANTTMEDLHTAIAKHTETGYEAYATAEGSTLEGMSAPPFENQTLEDAYPSFAIASTDAPRAKGGATVPMAQPKQPEQEEHAGVDRRATTRERREAPPRRMANNDTEELLEGLMPADLAAIREQHRKQRAEKLPWGRETARTAQSRIEQPRPSRASNEGSLATSEPSTPSTATPIAAEVAPRAQRTGRYARPWLAWVAAVALIATGFFATTMIRSARRASASADSRSDALSSAAPNPTLSSPAAAASSVVEIARRPEGAPVVPSAATGRPAADARPVLAPKRIAPVTRVPAASPSLAKSVETVAAPPIPVTPPTPAPSPKDDFVRTL